MGKEFFPEPSASCGENTTGVEDFEFSPRAPDQMTFAQRNGTKVEGTFEVAYGLYTAQVDAPKERVGEAQSVMKDPSCDFLCKAVYVRTLNALSS